MQFDGLIAQHEVRRPGSIGLPPKRFAEILIGNMILIDARQSDSELAGPAGSGRTSGGWQDQREIDVKIHRNTTMVLVLILLLSIAGIFSIRSEFTTPEKPLEPLRVAATQSALLVWLALDGGFFEEQGLAVEVNFTQGGHVTTQQLLNHQVSLATCSEFVLASHILSGDDLRVVGTVAIADTISLVGRRDRGIQSLQDVKGMRIGVTRNSASDYFLGALLSFNGIGPHQFTPVYLEPAEIRNSMIDGTVDAGITWDPYIFEVTQALGHNAVLISAQSHQKFHFLTVSRPDWIATHRETLKRYTKALFAAERFYASHNVQAKEALASRFSYQPSYLDAVLSHQDLVVSLPQSLLIAMEDAAQWKIDTKQVKEKTVPNFLKYVEFDPVKSVDPTRVTIIH